MVSSPSSLRKTAGFFNDLSRKQELGRLQGLWKAENEESVGTYELNTHCSAWRNALTASEIQVAELREAVHGVQSDPRALCGYQRPHRSTCPSHLYMQKLYFRLD